MEAYRAPKQNKDGVVEGEKLMPSDAPRLEPDMEMVQQLGTISP